MFNIVIKMRWELIKKQKKRRNDKKKYRDKQKDSFELWRRVQYNHNDDRNASHLTH